MKFKFRHHNDPGHGWAEVPIALVNELALAPLISEYSYIALDGATAYLEEDCDVSKLLRALEARGDSYEFDDIYMHSECFVRSLPRFTVRAALGKPQLTLWDMGRDVSARSVGSDADGGL